VTRKNIAVVALIVVVVAAIFARLGIWQLDRRAQRRDRNAALSTRLMQPVVPFAELRDTIGYRRAAVVGQPDYENEIILTGRSRQGSPGVYLMTPVRRTSSDTAVMVIRGWVYAPDAATIDQQPWREGRASFSGYVSALPQQSASSSALPGRKLRVLTDSGVRALLPYPVSRLYLVSQDTGNERTPARLPPPALDDGPHLSYAIQWFFFAALTLIGATIAIWHESRRNRGTPTA
jgi:surfeit locus 1 family protein